MSLLELRYGQFMHWTLEAKLSVYKSAQQHMLKEMQAILFVLNTRLGQLTGSVGCDWVEDSHNLNVSRCPNGQTSLSQLVGGQVEDSYNSKRTRMYLKVKLVKTQVVYWTQTPQHYFFGNEIPKN